MGSPIDLHPAEGRPIRSGRSAPVSGVRHPPKHLAITDDSSARVRISLRPSLFSYAFISRSPGCIVATNKKLARPCASIPAKALILGVVLF